MIHFNYFSGAVYFINRRRCHKRSPKFGNYQRNILTFQQTLFYGIGVLVTGYFFSILTSMFDYIDMPIVTVRKLMFWGNILIFNLFFGFLTPVLVLLNLCRKMPDFYCTKINYISVNKFTMTVKPRRDFDYLSFNNSNHNNHIDVGSNCRRDIFVLTETRYQARSTLIVQVKRLCPFLYSHIKLKRTK